MVNSLRRAQILGAALSERFRRDPRALADASGVYVRTARLHSSLVLFAPGSVEQQPPVVAIAEQLHEPARSFLLAWALGLWALGYQAQAIYWRVSDGPAFEGDPADLAATAFATTFLDRESMRSSAGSAGR